MIRVFLAVLAMFFLPFALYAAYNFVRRKGDTNESLFDGAPLNWLSLAGTILAVATLARLVSMDILEYERKTNAPAETGGAETPGMNRR